MPSVPPSSAPPAARRLAPATVWRYASGSIATGGFSTLPGLVLVYYLTDTLGVGVLLAGLVLVAAKVWDMLIDPLLGALSDRDLARHGSRRRLMLVGGVLLPLAFMLTFAVPVGLAPGPAGTWVLLAFMLAATGFSLFQVPYVTLPAEITADYDERTRLLAWRVVALAAAILLFGAGGPLLRAWAGGGPRGYLVMAAGAALVFGVGMLVARGAAPCRCAAPGVPPPAFMAGMLGHYRAGCAVLRESQPFRALLGAYVLQAVAIGEMLAATSYAATWLLDAEDAVGALFAALIAPALACTPLWGRLARRLGKQRVYLAASVLFVPGALALTGLAGASAHGVYAAVALCGVAYAAMQALPLAMLPDVIALDVRRGDRAGVFGGVWT